MCARANRVPGRQAENRDQRIQVADAEWLGGFLRLALCADEQQTSANSRAESGSSARALQRFRRIFSAEKRSEAQVDMYGNNMARGVRGIVNSFPIRLYRGSRAFRLTACTLYHVRLTECRHCLRT